MPFNPQGLLQRLYSWIQERDQNQKIQAYKMDQEFNNIISAINQLTTGQVKIKGQMQPEGGNPETPGYAFYHDSDTGMYTNQQDHLGFASKGVEAFKINDKQEIYFAKQTHFNQSVIFNQSVNFNHAVDFNQSIKAHLGLELVSKDNDANSSNHAIYLAPQKTKQTHKLFLKELWTVFQSHKDKGWKYQDEQGDDIFILGAGGFIEIFGKTHSLSYIDFKFQKDRDFDVRLMVKPNHVMFGANSQDFSFSLDTPITAHNYIKYHSDGKVQWAIGKAADGNFYIHRHNPDGSWKEVVFQINKDNGHIWTKHLGWIKDYIVQDVRIIDQTTLQKKIFNAWYTIGTIAEIHNHYDNDSGGRDSEIPPY